MATSGPANAYARPIELSTPAGFHPVTGVPPPPFEDLDPRSQLLDLLDRRLRNQAQDVFTAAGLGHAAGQLYAQISTCFVTVTELAPASGRSPDEVGALLGALISVRLILRDRDGHRWRRPVRDRRTSEAKHRGIAGMLADRAARYQLERELWAWWLTEWSG